MSEWMNTLFNLSLAASFVVVTVLPLRWLLRRAPKKYSYLMWSVVFWRAVCPISFFSPISLFRLFPLMGTDGNRLEFSVGATLQGTGNAWNLVRGSSDAGNVGTNLTEIAMPENTGAVSWWNRVEPGEICFYLWLIGIVVLLVCAGVSWLRLRRKVAWAVRVEEGVYESDRISTAFLLGMFRPRIYLPTGLAGRERVFVQEHERVHLGRHDHHIKMLAWFIVLAHWFNPLMWLAFYLMVRDMEMSCDEKVLKNLSGESKEEYGSFLLALAAPAHFPVGNFPAFGESSVKQRIRNILRYRKESWKTAVIVLALVAVWSFTCLANPAQTQDAAGMDGLDNTSVFLFGTEEDPASEPEVQFLMRWARAVADRDADAVYGMLSPALQADAEQLGVYEVDDGEWVMGWSSPFVSEDVSPIIVMNVEDGKISAEITYPAMTSDPLWWVWKDYITLEKQGEEWQVAQWEQRDFFEISSYQDFKEAYENWFPDYLSGSEESEDDSFAAYLQKGHDDGFNPEYYDRFLSPLDALVLTMHLSGGEGIIEDRNYGEVYVNYRWPDGEVRIRMVQPFREDPDGIWAPWAWE
ncbi:MAG: M56 family metallopeptidase [Candidatus Gastranaerophilales bacterium]|nr:M56 family metallopeptidase [Candidatus Gastranaerophilales bacterium]